MDILLYYPYVPSMNDMLKYMSVELHFFLQLLKKSRRMIDWRNIIQTLKGY